MATQDKCCSIVPYFAVHDGQLDNFKKLCEDFVATTDTEARYKLLGDMQELITKDAVNAYLFELAKIGVWNAKVEGLWTNSPIQANDLTGVKWKD